MEPPKCRICGEKHWGPLCHQRAKPRRLQPVTMQVPLAQGSNTLPEIEALRAEVGWLKRELALRECPVCKRRRESRSESRKAKR